MDDICSLRLITGWGGLCWVCENTLAGASSGLVNIMIGEYNLRSWNGFSNKSSYTPDACFFFLWTICTKNIFQTADWAGVWEITQRKNRSRSTFPTFCTVTIQKKIVKASCGKVSSLICRARSLAAALSSQMRRYHLKTEPWTVPLTS